MMLDIYARQSAGLSPIIRSAEFCRIELAPRNEGLFVSLTATVVDDQEPQLLDHEIACEHVGTIDALLGLIRDHVHIAAPAAPLPSHIS
jgi:hypothetical protein